MWYSITCPSCGTKFRMQGEGADQTRVPVVPVHGPPDDTAIDCPGGYAEPINVAPTDEPGRSRPRPVS